MLIFIFLQLALMFLYLCVFIICVSFCFGFFVVFQLFPILSSRKQSLREHDTFAVFSVDEKSLGDWKTSLTSSCDIILPLVWRCT